MFPCCVLREGNSYLYSDKLVNASVILAYPGLTKDFDSPPPKVHWNKISKDMSSIRAC